MNENTAKKMNNRSIIKILFRKEMKDIFRDRKSILMMILVPVVLYPIIFFVSFMIMNMMQNGAGTPTYTIAIVGEDNGRLESALNDAKKENDTKEDGITSKAKYKLMIIDEKDFNALYDGLQVEKNEKDDKVATTLENRVVDAYVTIAPGATKDSASYEVSFNSSESRSSSASGLVMDAVNAMGSEVTNRLIKDAGLDPEAVLKPYKIEEKDTATSEQSMGFFLGTIIPFMLIMSLLIGVFTPAIDAMSGEKERGTLETLLMLPVTNGQIIIAKFLAVSLVGLITAVLSIVSMAGLGVYMLNIIESSGTMNTGGISAATFLPVILLSIPVLIVLSLFLTAVSMCVSCFAKSYKEANTYMSPVMIVVILTGYIGFIPNIEFDRTMAMIPIANVCLLVKNLLLFKVNIDLVLIVILSTAVYTGIVILILGKVYRSEAILFDEGKNGLTLIERRSNMDKGGVPSAGDSWFVVLVGFLLLLYVGGLLQIRYGLNGVAMSQIVLLVFPFIMAVYTRKHPFRTFNLRMPRVGAIFKDRGVVEYVGGVKKGASVAKAWIGSVVLGFGAILMGIVMANIMTTLFPQEGEAFYSTIETMFVGPGVWVWAVVCVFPAICEEMLFRGYILSGFRNRYPEWATVVAVGVSFGVFHTSVMRFPATCFLGMTFAFIVCRTGSIIPGMILHCLNNSIAIICMYFPEFIKNNLPFLADGEVSVFSTLCTTGAALVLLIIGVLLLRKKEKER